MPPTDPETIGGISTGFSLYSGRLCVPPYSQNAGVASSYIVFGNCLHVILVNCYNSYQLLFLKAI